MKKLNYTDINSQQLVDIRSQHDYQSGHVDKSLNLNPKNFRKYAHQFLSVDEPILFIGVDVNELKEVYSSAQEMEFNVLEGYLQLSDVPSEELKETEKVSAGTFLEKSDDYILLDVRHPNEITRPAPENNLVNIALEDLSKEYSKLDESRTVYTLCGSGNRGTSAASYLETKGYKTTVIEGGMKAIQEITQE